jgi:hypothetical protein
MESHAHICLCDEAWNFYYDHVDFDIHSSVNTYLDLIFNIFNPESIDRSAVESEMYHYVDNKMSRPIYFKADDFIYLWIQCTGCRVPSLN